MVYRKKFKSFERRMYKITCSKCGNAGEVPFKPREGIQFFAEIVF